MSPINILPVNGLDFGAIDSKGDQDMYMHMQEVNIQH